MKRNQQRAIVLLSVLLGIGCQSTRDNFPHIRYGEQTCDRCGMIISEKRFSAAYRTGKGELLKFDDFGCALLHRAEQQEAIAQVWGYDYEETGWLDARGAFFVNSPTVTTPMGYGIVAFSTQEKAEAYAKRVKGQTLQFDPLVSTWLISQK